MIRLIVIGSNSRGNCYALCSEEETLVIEAGCRAKDFKRVLDYDYPPICGVVISHEHGDHSKYARDYISLGATLYGNEEIVRKYGNAGIDTVMKEGQTYYAGKFSIAPFNLYHDVPCFGFLIHHPKCGSILFATDTYGFPFAFHGVKHWIIEANYTDDILDSKVESGTLSETQRKRIIVSHMSIDNAIINMRNGCAQESRTATLIHLSSRHSDKELFQKRVEQEFGIPCYIAESGTEVFLS